MAKFGEEAAQAATKMMGDGVMFTDATPPGMDHVGQPDILVEVKSSGLIHLILMVEDAVVFTVVTDAIGALKLSQDLMAAGILADEAVGSPILKGVAIPPEIAKLINKGRAAAQSTQSSVGDDSSSSEETK